MEKQDSNEQTSDDKRGRQSAIDLNDIASEELRTVDATKRMEDAQKLNAAATRTSKDRGISRRRHRKRYKDHQSCSSTFAQITGDENWALIKAKYGDSFIRFQLPASSGIDEFHNQVSMRLELEAGDYIIKYLNEDGDWIVIACDNDLRYYISNSMSGKNPLQVTLDHA